jgi:beta-N-acetylhexosaminidase
MSASYSPVDLSPAGDSLSRQAATVLMPGFVGTELPEWLAVRLRSGLGAVCLFLDNIVSREQLRSLTAQIHQANPLALIAIDEEGGDVTRLYQRIGSPYPGNAVLGRIDDPAYTEESARSIGWELRLAGCTLDFAPDVDINSNPDNPVIGVRSFGSDPELVARHSAAWVRGLESTGVAASAKHFPGHGDTAQDSHLALPVIDRSLAELRERELLPFRAAIAAGSRTIMSSHIMVPQLDPAAPATFSRAILLELLRGELGFDGVIVSDALDMVGASGEIGIPEAAVRAIAGGCDLLCIGTRNTQEQLEAIEAAFALAIDDGRLGADRLADAASRTLALARELAARADALPVPSSIAADGEPQFDLARTAASFDVQPGVVVRAERRIVALETVANIAVGVSPWGAGAAGAEVESIVEGDALDLADDSGTQLVLIGKANHRYRWVRDLVDEARARHPETIVIDMGWPGDDRRYADVATFGASRHVGNALLGWLAAAQRDDEKERVKLQ